MHKDLTTFVWQQIEEYDTAGKIFLFFFPYILRVRAYDTKAHLAECNEAKPTSIKLPLYCNWLLLAPANEIAAFSH